jgi:hypothetical protein
MEFSHNLKVRMIDGVTLFLDLRAFITENQDKQMGRVWEGSSILAPNDLGYTAWCGCIYYECRQCSVCTVQ